MRMLRIIGFVFTVLGLVLLALGGWFYTERQKFLESSSIGHGTVVDLASGEESSNRSSRMAHPVVKFETGGGETIQFRSSYGSSPPAYEVGEAVTVRFDPRDPHNASIDSFVANWLVPIILGTIGFLFASAGGIAAFIPFVLARRERWLMDNGQMVSASIQSVQQDPSYRKGGRYAHRIVCQWVDPATRQVYVFQSKPLWYNPESFLETKEIPVRIDPDNPGRYLVDTSFLPRSAN